MAILVQHNKNDVHVSYKIVDSELYAEIVNQLKKQE